MRLFIAIDVPDAFNASLKDIQASLEGPGRLILPKAFHLTLKFLGDVSEERYLHIQPILRSVKFRQFPLTTSSLGVFPSESYLQVIWLGFEPSQPLAKLQKEISKALESYYPHEKNFIPHITLARVKSVQDKPKLLEKLKTPVPPMSWEATDIKLCRSILTPNGPEYTELMSLISK
ncbi:MAG TPA: RNA 2',3'-cyclic phosphodiesterase [Candidatus Nanoarchaeia archaeon]|nr:RNA 2',3'-cyclic phosphodiesterase [Candidatus Nanoarchaeia archaeon]